MDDSFFITGGNLPPDAPSYVTRAADAVLLSTLIRGDFCYVLTSRQMGKSSLMTRMVLQLKTHGVAPAVLDLSSQGYRLNPGQWYRGLLDQLAGRLQIDDAMDAFCEAHQNLSPLQLWQQALSKVVLKEVAGPITIFIDEIDVVRSLPFSTDEFFAAIRSCYNARTADDDYKRLSFCLLGVATPTELISNEEITPFNIGVRIDLTDFSREESSILEVGLGRSAPESSELIARILYWSGGHPYLTQRLCQTVAQSSEIHSSVGVDECARRLFMPDKTNRLESNLAFVQQQMLPDYSETRAEVLTLYSRVLRGESVPDLDTIPGVSRLKLAGTVRGVDGRLVPRNRIYAAAFDQKWVLENMPDAELRRQRTAFRRGQLRAAAYASSIIAALGILAGWAISAQHRATVYRDASDRANLVAQERLREANRASYDISMNLIQREWEQNNIQHVLQLLATTKASPYRGFEWGYWFRLCHQEELSIKCSQANVYAVAWSPNNRVFATGGRDLAVRIWDARTGREVARFLPPEITRYRNRAGVSSLAFSPDAKHLFVGCENTLFQIDPVSGHLERSIAGTISTVNDGTFSPDSRFMAASVCDQPSSFALPRRNVIVVWNVNTGQRVMSLKPKELSVSSKAVVYSPDGKWIATGNYDSTVRLWDAKTGRQVRVFKDPSNLYIASIQFSPDGRRIVASGKHPFVPEYPVAPNSNNSEGADSQGSTVRVWDVGTGACLLALRGYLTTVKCVRFSPDGKLLLTGGYDNTARIWDSFTGKELLVLRGHTNYVVAEAFSMDGKRVVTTGYDETARVWDIGRLLEGTQTSIRTGRVTSVAPMPDGKRVVVGCDDSPVTWDPYTRRENVIHHRDFGGPAPKTDIAGIFGHGAASRHLDLIGHTDSVTSVSCSPLGDLAASGSRDMTCRFWNTTTGTEYARLADVYGVVGATAFSRDGRYVAVGTDNRDCYGPVDIRVRIWDVRNRAVVGMLPACSDGITSLAFSPDGRRVAAACRDRMVHVWQITDNRELFCLKGHTDEVTSVCFSPDGKQLVSGACDNTAIVWDCVTGQQVMTLAGHVDNVNSVDFSPDGTRILTSSDDQTARIWDAVSGRELLTLNGHMRSVTAAQFTRDGNSIVTGSSDKTVRIWNTRFD